MNQINGEYIVIDYSPSVFVHKEQENIFFSCQKSGKIKKIVPENSENDNIDDSQKLELIVDVWVFEVNGEKYGLEVPSGEFPAGEFQWKIRGHSLTIDIKVQYESVTNIFKCIN